MASPIVDEIWKENMLPIGVGATAIAELWREAGKGHHMGGKGAVEARRHEIRTNAAEGTVGLFEDEQRRGGARLREPLQWRRDPVLGRTNRWGHQRSEAVGEDAGAGERGGKGPSASQAQSGRAPGSVRNQNATEGGEGKGEEKAAQLEGGRGSGAIAKGNGKGTEKGGEAGARIEAVEQVATMQVGQGGKKKEGPQGPVERPRLFTPPPLARHILASRERALKERVEVIQGRCPEDPRLEQAREALGTARQWVREAGGPSAKKLCFSLLDEHSRVDRCKAEIERAKEAVQAAKAKVDDAVAALVVEEDRLEASEAKHHNANARLAYLSFQVAVEGGQRVEGYARLAEDQAKIEAAVFAARAQGTFSTDLRGEIQRVWNFIRQFEPTKYDPEDDPELQKLASSPSSNHTIQVDLDTVSLKSAKSEVTVGVDWKEQEAKAEEEAVRHEARLEEVPCQEDGAAAHAALELVRGAAASAAVNIQLAAARGTVEKVEGGALALQRMAERACRDPLPNSERPLAPTGGGTVRPLRSKENARGRSRSKEGAWKRGGAEVECRALAIYTGGEDRLRENQASGSTSRRGALPPGPKRARSLAICDRGKGSMQD